MSPGALPREPRPWKPDWMRMRSSGLLAALALGLVLPIGLTEGGAAAEHNVALLCRMPVTPSQVNEFSLDLHVSIALAATPTAGASLPVAAAVTMEPMTNPADFSVTVGPFDLAMFVEGAASPLRFTGPEQVLHTGASLTNPIAEFDGSIEITGAPGSQLVFDAYRFTYSIRLDAGGPVVSCVPADGVPVRLFSARIHEPIRAACKGVAATILGTDADDTIVGTQGDDVISLGAGHDTVFGLGGDDQICGGHGDDEIMGGPGLDQLFGEGGRDTLIGGVDHDVVDGGGQIDTCQSGTSKRCESSPAAHQRTLRLECRVWLSRVPPLYQDFFLDVHARVAAPGAVESGGVAAVDVSFETELSGPGVPGSMQASVVVVGATRSLLHAEASSDGEHPGALAELQFEVPVGIAGERLTIEFSGLDYPVTIPGFGSTFASCRSGDVLSPILLNIPVLAPSATCKGSVPRIAGSPHDDVLVGTSGDDVIQAGAGNDVVFGLGGDDIICGSHGDDVLLGGGGADLLYGEGGRDDARGGSGQDLVHGGGQTDRCSSGTPIACELPGN